MIKFSCEGCGKQFTTPDDKAGLSGKCSACGKAIVVPVPDGGIIFDEVKKKPSAPFPTPPTPVPEEKRKHNKGGTFLRWCTFVFLIFMVIGMMTTSFVAALPTIVAALLVLPPAIKRLEERFNFTLTRSARIFVVMALFFVSMMMFVKAENKNNAERLEAERQNKAKYLKQNTSEVTRKLNKLIQAGKLKEAVEYGGDFRGLGNKEIDDAVATSREKLNQIDRENAKKAAAENATAEKVDSEADKMFLVEKGKRAIKEKLKDPKSAQFRNVYFHRGKNGSRMVCGQVNSKNSFGGFSGFQHFVSTGTSSLTFLETEISSKDFPEVWNRYCVY